MNQKADSSGQTEVEVDPVEGRSIALAQCEIIRILAKAIVGDAVARSTAVLRPEPGATEAKVR